MKTDNLIAFVSIIGSIIGGLAQVVVSSCDLYKFSKDNKSEQKTTADTTTKTEEV